MDLENTTPGLVGVSMKRILIIAAHPDDDILGCGGTIAKQKEMGAEVKVVFVAEGTSCRFHEVNNPGIEKELKKRNAAGVNALASLGVQDYVFCNLPCGRLDQVPQIEINKILEREIQIFQPDTIFTHSAKDTNVDHRIVNACTRIATRPISSAKVQQVFAYEVLSSSEWNFDEVFSPNYFVSLEERHVVAKITALTFYDSEIHDFPHPRSSEGIKALAQYRGLQCAEMYAEAFQVTRMIN